MSTHRRPQPLPWWKRALERLRARRQRRHVEAARDLAYVVRIEAHNPPPQAWMRAALAARIAAYSGAIAATPPAAVLPDEPVPGLEHLSEGQYPDDTHAFSRYVEGGQE